MDVFRISLKIMKIVVKVNTNSRDVGISNVSKNEYKVSVSASAKEGKANKELIEIVSDHFDVPKTYVEIVKGKNSRRKILEIYS